MPKTVAGNKQSEKWVSEIVGVFTDPIIVMPGGWGDTLPEWIKTAITLGRLMENVRALKDEEMTGSDAEACAYLYTASLTAPMGSDWSQIYLYLAGKVMKQYNKTEMPPDIAVESISHYQMGMLRHLKSWIYERRVRTRLEHDRAEKRQKQEAAVVEKESLQPALFDLQ